MSNLSTADKTIDIATCGDITEGVPSHCADPEVLDSSSEEGEIRENLDLSNEEEIRKDPNPGKRGRSPDEQSAAKRMKGPGPDVFNFSDIFHVRNRLNCIIQVNDLPPFGTFETTTRGWMIRMFMDPGRFGRPTITLGFSKNGGKDLGRCTWDVDAYVQGEWAMNNLTVTHISAQDPLHFSHTDYQATMACSTRSDMASLMSMKFRSWGMAIGYDGLRKAPAQNESIQFPSESKISMDTIFHPQEPYMLTIWFIAPYDRELFQRNCLGVYTRALAARRPPLYNFIDDSGARLPAFTGSGGGNLMALGEDEQTIAPEAATASELQEEGEPKESTSMRRDKTEVESHRQYPHLGPQAPQPTSKPGPELTGEFPIHERDMEVSRQLATPSYPAPLQAESDRASVERGSKATPELSRARSDTSPNRTVGSDISPRPNSPLGLSEPEVSNVMDLSETPTGTRVNRSPESPPSPKDGSGSSMAYRGSEAAPLDLETTAKGSADPHDLTELTLTTERPSSPPPPKETNENSSFSLLRENSPSPPREYSGAVPSFLFGPLQADDESEEDESEEGEEDEPEEVDGDGSEG